MMSRCKTRALWSVIMSDCFFLFSFFCSVLQYIAFNSLISAILLLRCFFFQILWETWFITPVTFPVGRTYFHRSLTTKNFWDIGCILYPVLQSDIILQISFLPEWWLWGLLPWYREKRSNFNIFSKYNLINIFKWIHIHYKAQ